MRERTGSSARAAFEASPLPTILVDGEGCLVGGNRASRALFEGVDLFARPLAALFDSPGPAAIEEATAAVRRTGLPVSVHVRFRALTGSHEGRLVLGRLDRDDCRPAAVGVLEIDRKDEVDELVREAADREEVLACAAHEIRNAFFVVQGHANILRQRAGSLGPDDVAGIGETLASLVQRSEVLLADFADVRRPEDGGMEPIVLTDALSAAFSMFPPDETTVAVPDDTKVLAAPGRVEQIVNNLIRNARHHGGEHATVSVTVTCDEHEVALAVSDDGPGVPGWAEARVFDPFFRAGGVNVGSGLGLAIVKRLVESFGGTIRYEPNEPSGARFVVVLRKA